MSPAEQRDGELGKLERVVVLHRHRRGHLALPEPLLTLRRRAGSSLQAPRGLAAPPAPDGGRAAGLPSHHAAVQRSARPEAARRRRGLVVVLAGALPEQAVDPGRRAGGVGREEVGGDDGVGAVVRAGVGAPAIGAERLLAELDVEERAATADRLADGECTWDF